MWIIKDLKEITIKDPCLNCIISSEAICPCERKIIYGEQQRIFSQAKEVETVGKVFHKGEWCLLIPESSLTENLERG